MFHCLLKYCRAFFFFLFVSDLETDFKKKELTGSSKKQCSSDACQGNQIYTVSFKKKKKKSNAKEVEDLIIPSSSLESF